MAEATIDTNPTQDATASSEAAALRDLARQLDRARVRQLGSFHFAMVAGALTLWGAAETWAQVTGWGIAGLAAVANALVAGFVISSTIHEWGHFAGARLAGAESPTLDEPRRHFFMFDFPIEKNDTEQFLWMSWGGILAPWVAVLLVLLFVPIGITSGAVLLATLVARAVGVAVFEGPIARRTAAGGSPGAELSGQLAAGGLDRGRRVGTAVGIACFALIWLAV